MRVILSLFLISCATAGSGSESSNVATSDASIVQRPATRILIMRHAEKADPAAWNTDLKAPEGFDRAKAWVDILAPYRPSAFYTSNLQRTQHTLAPTAEARGVTPEVRPAVAASPDRPTVEDTKALAQEILDQHKDETTVVVWHTPYVQDLAVALGVPPAEVPEWDHDNYGSLWLVTLKRGGAPSTLVDLSR